jgi:hypothetical protein
MLGGVAPSVGMRDALLEYDGHSDDETARVIPQIVDPIPNDPDLRDPTVNDQIQNDPKVKNPKVNNPNGDDTLSLSKRSAIDMKSPVAKSGYIRTENDDIKGKLMQVLLCYPRLYWLELITNSPLLPSSVLLKRCVAPLTCSD